VAILELIGVEKRFGGLPALGGVTLSVDEGEIVALVGPNGAGKTTLLKAIGGVHRLSAGTIRFDGRSISGLRPHQARHAGIALVLQTPRAFENMTVRDNVVLGALFGGDRVAEHDAAVRADEMLEFVGLIGRRDELVGSLNLHERRFLELARQLAGRPRLILLDEVMAGLNDSELHDSVEMIRRARSELAVTVLWVEHVMKAVMTLAERVLVLDFGKVIADGLPREVMRQPDVVVAYLGEQAAAS
jgi:ABC-type branched-subunit amino acid transport system ATPase component